MAVIPNEVFPDSRLYKVVSVSRYGEDVVTKVQADQIYVDEKGTLLFYRGNYLIAAFSSGGWDTVAEELTDEQKAIAATQSVSLRKAEER